MDVVEDGAAPLDLQEAVPDSSNQWQQRESKGCAMEEVLTQFQHIQLSRWKMKKL